MTAKNGTKYGGWGRREVGLGVVGGDEVPLINTAGKGKGWKFIEFKII